MCAVGVAAGAQTDWPSWRGPDDKGASPDGNYAVSWGDGTNLLWKTELPGKGCSTPIVWNKRIFLTAPVDGQDAAMALDWSGKILWQTKLGVERAGKHRNGSGCNASPVTDGRSVFVYFKSGNFASLDMDGKLRWQTNLVDAFGRDTLFWDHGTSPVLTEKYVVMARMHRGESWLAAFDKDTGAIRWKTARNYETPNENDHSYNTPLVIRYEGREALLTWGGEHLTVHGAGDGKLLWSAAGFNPGGGRNWPAVAMPLLAGDVAVLAFGRSDRGNALLYGVRLGKSGEFDATNHLWKRTDTGTFVPSATEYKGRVYLLRDRGEVDCLDPITGKSFWSDSLPKSSANFYSSTVIAGDKLYAAREDGVVFVARVGDKFELLAENTMNDRVIATPVLLANRIFIRGEKICIASERIDHVLSG